MDDNAAKDAILLEALSNVVFDGWTDRALRDGVAAAGLSPAQGRRAFPNGVPDLVDHLADWADRQMEAAIAASDAVNTMGMTERVGFAVRARLEASTPYQEAIRRAAALLALPTFAPLAARLTYRPVDRIWPAVGDRSTDFNFYTKRALLAGVLTTTTLYWMNDRSEDRQASWAFLDRRLRSIVWIGGLVRRAGSISQLAEAPFRLAGALRSRVVGT